MTFRRNSRRIMHQGSTRTHWDLYQEGEGQIQHLPSGARSLLTASANKLNIIRIEWGSTFSIQIYDELIPGFPIFAKTWKMIPELSSHMIRVRNSFCQKICYKKRERVNVNLINYNKSWCLSLTPGSVPWCSHTSARVECHHCNVRRTQLKYI